MKVKFSFLLLITLFFSGLQGEEISNSFTSEDGIIQVLNLRRENTTRIRYPDALPSLLNLMNEHSLVSFDPFPLLIESLTDERFV